MPANFSGQGRRSQNAECRTVSECNSSFCILHSSFCISSLMRFDRKHKPWLIISPILLGLGALAYWRFSMSLPHGPDGGSWSGIIFGIIGLAMMLFAALLRVRKRFR